MATKLKKKKSPGKVRDLAARKDPKGGAQKKEGPASNASTRRGTGQTAGKARLS